MTISAARRTRWIVLISGPSTRIFRTPNGNAPNEIVQTGVSEHNSDVIAPANAKVLNEFNTKLPIMMINWMIFCGKIACNSRAKSKLLRLVIGVLICSGLSALAMVVAATTAGPAYCVTDDDSGRDGVFCVCVV